MEIFGRANASAFDRYGWMYYSRDVFDFYGAVLLGRLAVAHRRDRHDVRDRLRLGRSSDSGEDGTLLHVPRGDREALRLGDRDDRGDRQRTRRERVRDWVKFRREAIDEGRTATMKRVVLVPTKDPARTADLVATLLRGGIEVRRANEPFTAPRAHAYADDAVGSRRFDAGTYVIELSQPLGRAARAMLEPSPSLDTSFARTQIEAFQRNLRRGANVPGEGYEFYDVTAWSLPVVLRRRGILDGGCRADRGHVGARRRTHFSGRRRRGAERALRLRLLFGAQRRGASRLPPDGEWHTASASRSGRSRPAGGHSPAAHTSFASVAMTRTLHTNIERLARESGVVVYGANTAFTDAGQFGTGSGSVYDLRKPVVALVGEEGIGQTSYGAAWYVLEQRYGIPFTPVSARWLGFGDLSRFNVIVIPDGSAGTLNRLLGNDGATRIEDWVRAGGTLVTFGGASAWAARENVGLTTSRSVGADAKPDTSAASRSDTAAARRQAAEDLLAVTSPSTTPGRPASLPGSHFDVVLDRTHWLTSGYDEPRLTVLMEGSTFLTLSKEGANVAVFPRTGRLHRAGFVWPDNTERLLRNSALLIHEPMGGGHVVLFANEPFFRAWWHALDRLVLNALVMGPAF